MDDFFLPHALKTPQRLAIPGGNVDLERLMQEVIIPFAAGHPVVYRRYLCREDAFSAPISLPDAPITILEGSYSMLPDIRRHADYPGGSARTAIAARRRRAAEGF